MITFLLLAHIACAITSLSFAAGVLVATAKQNPSATDARAQKMWFGTVLTLASGITLTFATRAAARSSCISLLSFLSVIFMAQHYQKSMRRRTRQSRLQ